MERISKWMFTAVLICGIGVVASCSNEDLMEDVNGIRVESTSHRITAEQAKQNALNFVGKLRNETRADYKTLEVAEVKAIGKNNGVTRSIADSVNLDSLFYVVNFANNEGFVIAASDDREESVFAYVEEGSFSEIDSLEGGFGHFMDALIGNQICNRVSAYEENLLPDDPPIGGDDGSYRSDKFEVMSPLLVTKWGQTKYPKYEDEEFGYNKYCPGPYTGCVVTAISQICSYLKSPNHVSWSYNGVGGQSPIDWEKIISECSINKSYGHPYDAELRDQIAHLMRFWGSAFDADYSSDGTLVDSKKAIKTMKNLGYNVSDLTDYNATNVMEDLKTGNSIVYMRGNGRYYHVGFFFRKYVDGHAWVVDGYIHSRKNSKESIYLHCNWGWNGRKNGYFLSNVLNAEENPVYDSYVTTRASNNYRYELKTATITK